MESKLRPLSNKEKSLSVHNNEGNLQHQHTSRSSSYLWQLAEKLLYSSDRSSPLCHYYLDKPQFFPMCSLQVFFCMWGVLNFSDLVDDGTHNDAERRVYLIGIWRSNYPHTLRIALVLDWEVWRCKGSRRPLKITAACFHCGQKRRKHILALLLIISTEVSAEATVKWLRYNRGPFIIKDICLQEI